jgi:hypothetical protein
MARYIDIDKVIEGVSPYTHWGEDGEEVRLRELRTILSVYSTKDVVPRSEVEKYRRELGKVRFALAEANKDKQGLEKENEILSATNKTLALSRRGIEAELNKAKQEVAKQIFEEIENKLSANMSGECIDSADTLKWFDYFEIHLAEDIAELKKKYIGE